jgi:uncharacterized protein
LKDNKDILMKKYPLNDMALFGSYARNDFYKNSDLDILVDINAEVGLAFIDLAEEIESLTGMKVDLVSKLGIKPKYFEAIEQDLIYV